RIQVSGKHLVLASPVFRSQLTESYNLHKEGSVAIGVDSWDPEAFLVLMKSFHCRHRDVPRAVNVELLAKIILLVSYYDCLEVVEVYLDAWLASVSGSFATIYSRDSILWLWISCFLKLDDRFKEATSIAIKQSKSRVESLGLPISSRIIGNRDESSASHNKLVNHFHR
ncbi:hypothetical protein F5884DRAFT_686710, partial [Xylogone sp. PMI_703]